jgi:hypothetical protein
MRKGLRGERGGTVGGRSGRGGASSSELGIDATNCPSGG